MSWYNPIDIYSGGANWLGNNLGIGSGDPTNGDRNSLQGVGQSAMGLAGQGQTNYNNMTGALGQQADYLRGIQSGQNSVSSLQLQQALQQNQAQQASMAAGASPNNQAMATRQAMMNAGRQGYGLAGQQALAGIQERNAAAGTLGQMLLGQRGQDVNAAQTGYGAANQAYGTNLQNPQKTWGSVLQGAIGGAAGALATKSDRTAKTDIKDADSKSRSILDGLKAYSYKYKDEKDGKGDQYGIMAQDLESSGLGHAVINTSRGKYVDGAKAATSALGLTAALARRVSELEKK